MTNLKVYEYPITPGYARLHTHHVTGDKGTAIGFSLEDAVTNYNNGNYQADFSKLKKYDNKP